MAPQGAAHGASAQNNPGPACSFHLWRLVYLPAEVGRSIIRFDVDGHWDREIGSLGPTHAALAGRDLLDAPRPAGRRASRGWHGGTLHCTHHCRRFVSRPVGSAGSGTGAGAVPFRAESPRRCTKRESGRGEETGVVSVISVILLVPARCRLGAVTGIALLLEALLRRRHEWNRRAT